MRTILLTLSADFLFLMGGGWIPVASDNRHLREANGERLEVAPPPRPAVRFPGRCPGFVTEVTKSSITIQGIWGTISGSKSSRLDERRVYYCQGDPLIITINGRQITGVSAVSSSETLSVTDATGKTVTFRRVDQPLWRFEASGNLLAREISPFADGPYISSTETYRLSDVSVGDFVSLKAHREDAINICDTICIMRRPGGRVPPAPGEPKDRLKKFHVGMQALQDQEEKGIVVPEKSAKLQPEKSPAPPKIPPARP